MIFTQKMTKLGYFRLTIQANVKLDKTGKKTPLISIIMPCVYLVIMVVIYGYKQMQMIEVTISQI